MTDKAPDRISTYRGYVFVNQFKPGAVHWVRHDIHEDVFQMYVDANEARIDLEAENKRLREALTPSADTEAAYIGKFEMRVTRSLPGGVTECRLITVPWGTIKEIMTAIRERAALEDKK